MQYWPVAIFFKYKQKKAVYKLEMGKENTTFVFYRHTCRHYIGQLITFSFRSRIEKYKNITFSTLREPTEINLIMTPNLQRDKDITSTISSETN